MDWNLDDQAAALRMLAELHRQKGRVTGPMSEKAAEKEADKVKAFWSGMPGEEPK